MDARELCRQFEIEIVSSKPGEMETASDAVIDHLIAKHGADTMVLTLRILTETHPANRSQLNRVVITAVNAVCRVRRYAARGLAFLDVFDDIDIEQFHERAESSGLWTCPTWTIVTTMLLDRLRAAFPEPQKAARVPPKPPAAVTRVPAVRARIEVGKKLLDLRAKAPSSRAFGAAVRKQFDLDQASATEAMSVARLYGSRWEITSRMSWDGLVALSSPSLSARMRRALEARIIAGERIGAPEIRRARGRLAPGRPRRTKASVSAAA